MFDNSEIFVAPPQSKEDKEWLQALWHAEWGGDVMVSKGTVHTVHHAEALIAFRGGERVGAATFHLGNSEAVEIGENSEAELLSINATAHGIGVGSALLKAFEDQLRHKHVRRAWLITSNDNLDALRFYQRRGYRIVAVHTGAIDEARKVKPSIPAAGYYDIPIHDELELEKILL